MTKRAAIAEAKARRAKGENVKVMKMAGLACVPGRGLVAFVHYYVEAR